MEFPGLSKFSKIFFGQVMLKIRFGKFPAIFVPKIFPQNFKKLVKISDVKSTDLEKIPDLCFFPPSPKND